MTICTGNNKTPNHIIAVSTGTSHFAGAGWGNRKCRNASQIYSAQSGGQTFLKHVKQEIRTATHFVVFRRGPAIL